MEFGYLGLNKPYETIYTDGRKVRVYPNGSIVPTNADTNQDKPEKLNYVKLLAVPVLVGIIIVVATKGVDKIAQK